jgi:AraC-like DNA-binding protein
MDIIQLIAISTIIPIILIAISLFFSKSENYVSIRIFALLLLQIAILTTSTILRSSTDFWEYLPAAHLGNLFVFSLGPTLFLYIESFLNKRFKFKPQYLLFYAPFVVIFFYYLHKTIYQNYYYGQDHNETTYKLIESVENFIFFILIVIRFRKNGLTFKDIFLKFNDYRITWIRFIFVSSSIVWFYKLLSFIAVGRFIMYHSPTLHKAIYQNNITAYFIFIFMFFSILLYLVLNRSMIFHQKTKYSESQLSNEQKKIYKQKLIEYMDKERPHLDSELSMQKLSKLTGISSKITSQIINEMFEINFYDFINNYRVKESVRLFKDEKYAEWSILEVLLEAGFNSKSTFNKAFKRETGLTPREYKSQKRL